MTHSIEFNEWKEIKKCMHLLNEDKRIEANSRIIQSMEYISKNGTQYGEIWSSIIEAAGFFFYESSCN